MRRWRLLPAIGLLAGAAALLLGLVVLQGIFLAERRSSLASLDARRRALDQYARQALAESLSSRLTAVSRSIEEARSDLLVPAQGLLLVEDGRQLLPRRWKNAVGSQTPARRLHESLVAQAWPGSRSESPLSERIHLMRRIWDALSRHDRAAIEDSFRRFLGHRMLYVLPAGEDIPIALASVEMLFRQSTPRPELLRGLLRDGLSDGRGGRMEGLQRSLLARREKLTRADFEYLARRIQALSEETGVLHDDFYQRIIEEAAEEVSIPADLREPALVSNGRWYAEPRPDGTTRGVSVDLPALLDEVSGEMRLRGLLGQEGRLHLDAPGVLSLARADVRVESGEFEREKAQALRNQRIKAGWVVFCGLLTTLLAVMGVLWIRQERRYLDLKAEFVATVSHELRTPLASVRLLAETLEIRLGSAPESRDYPARIVREVDRLNFLVENILSFNRISRGKARPHLSDVNLGETVALVHEERCSGRPVELSTEGLDQAWMRGDPELLLLLFSNLYENACRYTSRRPIRISVDAESVDRQLIVRFADNGDGIPGGSEEKVFLEFSRAASGAQHKGSGLGLSICRRIMALHGGSIAVMKSGPEGTVFEMRFPRT